jgi:hypothetical protein
MRRLIIGGIPCPESAWDKLFPPEIGVEQKILTFYEVFSKGYLNKNFFELVQVVQNAIEEFKPNSIVMHDIGVSFGLLALIKLQKTKMPLDINKIVLFNGVFRGFNVLKSTHPLRIQMMAYDSFESEVVNNGGEVDGRLRPIYSDLCHIYRQISYSSISTLVSGFFGSRPTKQIDLSCEMLVIASKNDPYIAYECLNLLEKDFMNCRLTTLDYGHFPYSGDMNAIRNMVASFEAEPSRRFVKSKL